MCITDWLCRTAENNVLNQLYSNQFFFLEKLLEKVSINVFTLLLSPRHNSPHIPLLLTSYYCFQIFSIYAQLHFELFIYFCVWHMGLAEHIITPQKHFTIRQCSSTLFLKSGCCESSKKAKNNCELCPWAFSQEHRKEFPASRVGGAKWREQTAISNQKDIHLGGSAIRNGLDKSVLTYTTREGITPVFLISTLFSRVWKDSPGAPEKEKYSICSHVKYLRENLKLVKTLSIPTYLRNCKSGNLWKTSEISENIIFPSLKLFHLSKDWAF